ncbi:MAG TPA: zinc-binding dehydrogenase [Puia sp.]|nr:zinc-binding dehydrogenase [Puia sp.]
MKALVIAEKNAPPVWRTVADPVAGPGEAIVRVYAAALNHRDVWIQRGQYAGLRWPIVVGSDGAGVVVSSGESVSSGTADSSGAATWVGKEVIINPSIGWGDHEGYQAPAGFNVLGLPDDGTLAEYVRVPVANLVEKPAHLSWEEAAGLPLAGITAFRSVVVRARVQAGERVLITGVGGGVALFALQFAVALGAKVYVSSGSGVKLDKAMAMGASGGVNYRNPGWAQSLRQLAGGFDVIIDGTAGPSVNDLLDLAAPGGRVVFYGATLGNASDVLVRRIFWKQLNVLGSTMGSPADFAAMTTFVSSHGLRPVVDSVFSAEDGAAAFARMEEGQQFGKIVIKIR